MPAAADDGGVELFESGAILLYLADKYGGLDTPEKVLSNKFACLEVACTHQLWG